MNAIVVGCNSMDREIAALWSEYRETGSQQAFDRLTLHYSPIVKFAQARLGDSSEPAMRSGLDSLRGAIESFSGEDRFEHYLLGCVTNEVDVPVW